MAMELEKNGWFCKVLNKCFKKLIKTLKIILIGLGNFLDVRVRKRGGKGIHKKLMVKSVAYKHIKHGKRVGSTITLKYSLHMALPST